MKRHKIIEGIHDPSILQEHDTNLRNSNLQSDSDNPTPLDLVKPIFSIIKHYPPEWTKQIKHEL